MLEEVVTKSDNLSLIPRTHVERGENHFLKVTHTHTDTHSKIILVFELEFV